MDLDGFFRQRVDAGELTRRVGDSRPILMSFMAYREPAGIGIVVTDSGDTIGHDT